jgi:hypothetical protein
MFCKVEDLSTESDVEQKFLWPMLTATIPVGLGYSAVDIKTKPDLRRLTINKGEAEKLYHPDYAIVIAGIPIFIIEAKRKDEARYSRRNRLPPSGVNCTCGGSPLAQSIVWWRRSQSRMIDLPRSRNSGQFFQNPAVSANR